MTNREEEMKILVIGDSGVGKTAIANRFIRDIYQEERNRTIGSDFSSKRVEVNNQSCRLQIWDLAGHERFRALLPIYYRGAEAALLVYDITRPETMDPLRGWVEELKSKLNEEIVFFLVGAKVDLVSDPNDVIRIVEQYGNEINATCTVTSAKENIGIDDTFVQIARQVLDRRILERFVQKEIETSIHLTKVVLNRKGRC